MFARGGGGTSKKEEAGVMKWGGKIIDGSRSWSGRREDHEGGEMMFFFEAEGK